MTDTRNGASSGMDVFDRHGSIDLRFVKPVVDGDTVTVRGTVVSVEDTAEGRSVAVDVWCETSMATAPRSAP